MIARTNCCLGVFYLGYTMNKSKICTTCQQKFPATSEYFHKCKNGKLGYSSKCKVCTLQKIDRAKRSKYHKAYYQKNRIEIIEKQLVYIKNNRNKINSRHNKKYHSDITYKIKHNLKRRMNNAIKGCFKDRSVIKLLGSDLETVKNHLESKFTEGMSWDNYGKWHIDHIIPCASFDLSDIEQQKVCFHYSNLQPLWAEDNLRKGDKVPDTF